MNGTTRGSLKVAFAAESDADATAHRILVEAIAGTEILPGEPPFLLRRRRGWSNVFKVVPRLIRAAHFTLDLDALVFIVDSDDSEPHSHSHDESPGANCRLCQLRKLIDTERARLKPLQHRRMTLKFAVGLAVPAIEAWFRCGRDPHNTEAEWTRAARPLHAACRRLKREVYGTENPTGEVLMRRATEAARRLADDLEALERHFPGGFGALARDIQGWRAGIE